MPIAFACQNCHQSYKVSEVLAGKGMKCKVCGTIVRIPGTPTPPSTPTTPTPSPSKSMLAEFVAANRPPSAGSVVSRPSSGESRATPERPAPKVTAPPPPAPDVDVYGLEEEPDPILPAHQVMAAPRPKQESTDPPVPHWVNAKKSSEKGGSGKTAGIAAGGGVSFIVVLFITFRVIKALGRISSGMDEGPQNEPPVWEQPINGIDSPPLPVRPGFEAPPTGFDPAPPGGPEPAPPVGFDPGGPVGIPEVSAPVADPNVPVGGPESSFPGAGDVTPPASQPFLP